MQALRPLLLGLIASSLLWTIPKPAYSMAFRQVSMSQGQGIGGGAVPVLDLSPTWGLTLSFLKTGELIQQARIGDPSRVVVDFDSPLAPAGGETAHPVAASSQSSVTGATLIYLRQLGTPLDLDLRLTQSAQNTHQVPLTVVTLDRSGNRKLYQFRLLLGQTTDYSTVEVVPDYQMPQPRPLSLVRGQPGVPPVKPTASPTPSTLDLPTRFEQAIQTAQAQQLITSPIAQRLQTMVTLLRQGKSLEAAAKEANIPMELVKQLLPTP